MAKPPWKTASPKSKSRPYEKNYTTPSTLRKKSPPKSVNSSTPNPSQKPFAASSKKPRNNQIQRSFVMIVFSCFNIKPAAATILAISFFFISMILHDMPYFHDLQEWFLVHHLYVWSN